MQSSFSLSVFEIPKENNIKMWQTAALVFLSMLYICHWIDQEKVLYTRDGQHILQHIYYIFIPSFKTALRNWGIEILKPYCKLIKFTFLTIWNSAAFFNDLFPCTISVFATEYHIELGKEIKK